MAGQISRTGRSRALQDIRPAGGHGPLAGRGVLRDRARGMDRPCSCSGDSGRLVSPMVDGEGPFTEGDHARVLPVDPEDLYLADMGASTACCRGA